MPKLKTKSSAKKRFRLTKTGQVHRTQAGKRHGMSKRDERQKRDRRGTTVANPTVARMIRAMFPYGSR